MKLERIEIKNYRSLFDDRAANTTFVLELGDGVNAIAGPNNVGKSNVLRALSLALDPDFRFDRSLDMPAGWVWSKPAVTLTFKVPAKGRPSRERTLLQRVDEYERKVNPGVKRTYADEGEVRLRVTIEGAEDSAGTRREVFVVRGGGARSLNDDDPVARRALETFHRCFHFVKIESGQSLESLLEGRFRDILHNVLRENLRNEFEGAEQVRAKYSEDLQGGLLKSLAERINAELKELFPEISEVSLSPQVPSLDETLAKMRVRVSDLAITDLADKGTGVRGGLIIAMLQHFADVGKRSMLFAVEEPESFLHPAAQERLREDLEALAKRRDISLVVTTHSPYIVSRQPGSKVFGLDKDSSGRTIVRAEAAGDKPHAGVLGGLYRDSLIMEWLDRTDQLPDNAKLFLVVEGSTDRDFAILALERAGRSDLLQGIEFRLAGSQDGGAGGGASMAVMQTLVTDAASPVPVAVLLDNDEPGRVAANVLRQIGRHTEKWRENKTLFSYRCCFKNAPKDLALEAEDLWPDHLLARFVEEHPEADRGRSLLPKDIGGWHYDIDAVFKGLLVDFLDEHARPDDCKRWVGLFEHIRQSTGLGPPVAEPAPIESGPRAALARQTPQIGSTERDRGGARATFVQAVAQLVCDDLLEVGLRPQAPHARGSYLRIKFGPSFSNLDGYHLDFRAIQDRAIVLLVINRHDARDANEAELLELRGRIERILAESIPTMPSAWTGGAGDAVRAYASSDLPGGGYEDGDVSATARWAVDMASGWARALRAVLDSDHR